MSGPLACLLGPILMVTRVLEDHVVLVKGCTLGFLSLLHEQKIVAQVNFELLDFVN
jgi:hypothetical protein